MRFLKISKFLQNLTIFQNIKIKKTLNISNVRNYNVPKTVTKSKKPTAEITNLSVAVMVDGKRVPVLDENGEIVMNDDGLPMTKYEPWSEAEIQNFQAIVASAIGIDPSRGDQIVIKNMEFAKTPKNECSFLNFFPSGIFRKNTAPRGPARQNRLLRPP